ncbi:MAG: class I SAM-dependent DNA methyltransferase [Oscillospiraceae bacterium]
MSGYSAFSRYYDVLTENIDYRARAEYFEKMIRRFGGKEGGILLDLACGTGSLSEEMARLGYDVIGVDSSEEMLNMALDKKFDSGLPIQYLCQDMTELDMFGTIDVTICALDSLNHLESLSDIKRTVEKVSLFCEPGGLFIFDMNTPYKHKNILADKTYVYDMEEVFCVWQNEYTGDIDNRVNICLDFFEKADGKNELYSRSSEDLSEIAFDRAVIEDILSGAGFELLAEYDHDSDDPPSEKSEKIVYAARKKK